jgi:hypothetical protein
MTQEGPTVVQELITYLKTAKPAKTMTRSKGIDNACHDHCKDHGPTGQTGHDGNDGS